MCDRIGCTHFPKLSEMDFSGAAVAVAPPLPERRRRRQHHQHGRWAAHVGHRPRRRAGEVDPRLGLLQPQHLPRPFAPVLQGRGHRAGVHQHADLGRDGDLPRHGPGRYRPDALHQLHGALRQGRAGQDRGRRRRRRLRHRRPSRPRFAREAQGQDARHLPDGYAGGHALRLPEEAQDLLQGREGPLHGQHARGRRGLQGGRHRLDLHHRALRLGAGGTTSRARSC